MGRQMGRTGRWNFRRRRRHKYIRWMATGNMVRLFPAVLVVFINLWWDVHYTGYFCSEEYYDEAFFKTIEKVVSWIDAYKSERGHLPDTLYVAGLAEVDWWRENTYSDTTSWRGTVFSYHHWDDSAYVLVSLDHRARFMSAPKLEGYIIRHDGSEEFDTVIRHH